MLALTIWLTKLAVMPTMAIIDINENALIRRKVLASGAAP